MADNAERTNQLLEAIQGKLAELITVQTTPAASPESGEPTGQQPQVPPDSQSGLLATLQELLAAIGGRLTPTALPGTPSEQPTTPAMGTDATLGEMVAALENVAARLPTVLPSQPGAPGAAGGTTDFGELADLLRKFLESIGRTLPEQASRSVIAGGVAVGKTEAGCACAEQFAELIRLVASIDSQLKAGVGGSKPAEPKTEEPEESLWDKIKSLMGPAKELAGAEKFGDIGAGMMDIAGKIGSILPGPLGKAAEGLAGVAKAAFEAVEGLRSWATQLQESNFQFAEFSAAMAAVQAEHEMRRMELSMERGDRRAESAAELSEALDNLNATLAPMEDAWAELKNKIGVELLEIVNGMAKELHDILAYVGLISKKDEDKPPEGAINMGKWMDSVAGTDPWLDTGRPSRFK